MCQGHVHSENLHIDKVKKHTKIFFIAFETIHLKISFILESNLTN